MSADTGTIRPATAVDRDVIIELIDTCLREINDRVFLEGESRDLLDVNAAYDQRGGAFVVLELNGEVIGTHATLPTDVEQGTATFRRLYLKRSHRGAGHGARLMEWAVDWCRTHGFKEIVFWSDTNFTRAHQLFESFDFTKGETREMNDGAVPYSEFHFRRRL